MTTYTAEHLRLANRDWVDGSVFPIWTPLPPARPQNTYFGTSGNDGFVGTSSADLFAMQDGGDDTVLGLGGNDIFGFGATLTAADHVYGGADYDIVNLYGGNYALTFAANTMTDVEEIDLGAGFNYALTMHDANVTGPALTVDGDGLGSGNSLIFDGHTETSSQFYVRSGDGPDSITVGAGNDLVYAYGGIDIVDMSLGGDDYVWAGSGDDTIGFGAALTPSDIVDGSDGFDYLLLNGDYAVLHQLVFSEFTVFGIEQFQLAAGHSYDLHTHNNTVAAGATLYVDASALGTSDHLFLDGSVESDGGRFIVFGSAGDDSFIDGSGDDTVYGGAGDDFLIFDWHSSDHDTAFGDAGDDTIYIFDATSTVDGGSGIDSLFLEAHASSGVYVMTPTTMANIDYLICDGETGAPDGYDVTLNNANVVGGLLVIDGLTLIAGQPLVFDGSAELESTLVIVGGADDDVLTGGAAINSFELQAGGNDTAYGGVGADSVNFGTAAGAFSAADRIDLAGGYDTVTLQADASVVFAPTTMTGVEALTLLAGNFDLKTDDATVASGQTLWIEVVSNSGMKFNGSAETDGAFFFSYTHAPFAASERITGGAGFDEVLLDCAMAPLILAAKTLKKIDAISFEGHSYDITTKDGNVAAGQFFTVKGTTLETGQTLRFDGSAETNGRFTMYGGEDNDVLIGGAKDDYFAGNQGGNDSFTGGDGNDSFYMGEALNAADRLAGGVGYDSLTLNGDYSPGVFLTNHTITNIESIVFVGGHSYKLTTNNGSVAAGATLAVYGNGIGAAEALTFNGSKEVNGHFDLRGGAGADVLVGGQLSDSLTGNLGADTLTGGLGGDHFLYAAVAESTGPGFDIVNGFDAAADNFDLLFAVTGVDATVASGTLRANHFNSHLAASVNSTHLAAHHAVLFTPSVGSYAGKTFVVVDVNGAAGYQAGQDLVIRLDGATNLASFGTGDFI